VQRIADIDRAEATTLAHERLPGAATASNGISLQPDNCAGPSVNCLVTGLGAGASAAANDLDGLQTSIQSPPIALPAGASITLRFQFYLAHLNDATAADYFRVRVVGNNGVAQTVYAVGATASNVAGAWKTRTVNLSAFAGQTVQIRVDAIDGGSASLIEAGFDNVVITRQ
jgi:aminopeptidase S